MSVRRRSNWYIYLIAFGIALAFAIMVIFTFRGFLFPEETEPVGLTSTGELAEDFKPDSSMNYNLLTMIADDGGFPELFIVCSYNAVDSRLTYVTIPNSICVTHEGRDLPNVYAAKGGEGVITAIENEIALRCNGYVLFERSEFINLFTAFGNVECEVPKTMLVNDNGEIETYNQGTQMFTAEKAYRYIMLADFEDGESYRFNMIGNLLSQLMNQNISYIDSSLLDTYVSALFTETQNNLAPEDYTRCKAALLNTILYTANPAEYYVPYGVYAEDGSFTISDNSITTIKQKAGIE